MTGQNISKVSSDDGLTDEEREFLTTPISQMAPESVRVGLARREKKAEHIYNLNAAHRAPKKAQFDAE